MKLSSEEAAAALAQIDTARSTMRQIVREHRGHYHMWIWGVAWVVMPLLVQFGGDRMARFFPWIALGGMLLSTWVGWLQGRTIRRPLDHRFIGALAAVLVFAAIFPFVLRSGGSLMPIYAYICLVVMQVYIIAGLWADIYLLWVGLLVTALILVGYFLLPGIFWPWMAVCGGGSLLLTGFYVRHFWR